MKPSLAGSDMIVTTMSGRASIFAFWTRTALGARPHHDVRAARKHLVCQSKKSLVLRSGAPLFNEQIAILD